MKSKLFTSFLLSIALYTTTYATDLYRPTRNVDLRLPSVPLIVSDPNFSTWSPYDKLMEGETTHWTNAPKSLIGALRVDGKSYRFLGKEKLDLQAIAPMTDTEIWEGTFLRKKPADNWTSLDFNDKEWKHGKAAFGSRDLPRIHTEWSEQNSDIYVRRTFDINELESERDFYIIYSHDDVFELYLNGEKLIATGEEWKNNVYLKLTDEAKKKLRKGKNVIAAHCHNTTGGAYVDFGLYCEKKDAVKFTAEAIQTSVDVLATSTYYTFTCGPVELDVVFTAPQLIDDLDLLSTPINYISYRVRSLDKKVHNVQLYFEATPELAVNENTQPTSAKIFSKNGIRYIEAGTIDQPICYHKGDGICIDWGYAYLAAPSKTGTEIGLGDYYEMKRSFIQNGKTGLSTLNWWAKCAEEQPAMTFVHNLGAVDKTGNTGFLMLGYDDIYSIEYMYERYMGYWKHEGKVSIFDAFEKLRDNYLQIMQRCRIQDETIYDDALEAGGKQYAEICSAAYRQAISAHKLFTDKDGNLLFFSKENNSGGFINTVDVTYPSTPLFLTYNIDLVKGMMTSIFDYNASKRWTKPYPAHDLGVYPIANGQIYGADMPVEESGNMVILSATIAKIEGNANYAKKYWDLLTIWTNYLVENGLDPENQLCTDDFAGHWAHNANLSLKAIMGITGYSEMARMLGMNDVADKYITIAKDMACKWESMAREGDHYRLAFDRKNTWSQKYNMIWDKMWQTNLFPDEITQKEIAYYLTKQNTYGLPLDSRNTYSKSDWILWSASMSANQTEFEKFVSPLYKYINETVSRVPMSDYFYTDSGKMVGFKARSVVGGYWIKVLMDKIHSSK